jgi:hypothetical protein
MNPSVLQHSGGNMEGYSLLTVLGFAWGAVTFLLVAMVIYRAVVGIHEVDSIHLDKAEAAMAQDQAATIQRIQALDIWLKWLGFASAILLLTIVGLWLYQGMYGTQSPTL